MKLFRLGYKTSSVFPKPRPSSLFIGKHGMIHYVTNCMEQSAFGSAPNQGIPRLMGPDGSLSCSQESSIGPCPESRKSSQHPSTRFITIHFNSILPPFCSERAGQFSCWLIGCIGGCTSHVTQFLTPAARGR